MLNRQFGNLADVVVTLLVTQTRETQGRLSTTSVLLWEIDGKFMDDLASVSGQGPEESAVTVHDDEAEAGV